MTKGIRFMLAAVFCFSVMAASAKALSRLPGEEVTFIRSAAMSVACILLIRREGGALLGHNRLFLLMRGMFGGTSMLAYFYSLQALPLATATIFYYVSPILTAIFASLFLGEKLRPVTALFFAVSFAGIILVKGFDHRVSNFGFLCGMTTALWSAAAYTAIGKLKGKESPHTIIFYLSAVATVLSLMVVCLRASWLNPSGGEWLWLLLVAAGAQAGQYFMTLAYFHEKSANVAIVNYVGIVFALGYGWLFWGETFNWLSLVGMAMVLSGVGLSVFFGKEGKKVAS